MIELKYKVNGNPYYVISKEDVKYIVDTEVKEEIELYIVNDKRYKVIEHFLNDEGGEV